MPEPHFRPASNPLCTTQAIQPPPNHPQAILHASTHIISHSPGSWVTCCCFRWRCCCCCCCKCTACCCYALLLRLQFHLARFSWHQLAGHPFWPECPLFWPLLVCFVWKVISEICFFSCIFNLVVQCNSNWILPMAKLQANPHRSTRLNKGQGKSK